MRNFTQNLKKGFIVTIEEIRKTKTMYREQYHHEKITQLEGALRVGCDYKPVVKVT